jgi:hypothetical protein
VLLGGGALTLGFLDCGQGPVEEDGAPSQSLSITAGRELDVMLQTVGPGEYASPPEISSAAVRFLDMELVTPGVPAGPTQRFRFRALTSGIAVVVFHHTVQGETVEDTVNVH